MAELVLANEAESNTAAVSKAADNPASLFAPHSPSYAREYTKTLITGQRARSRVSWFVPGTVWIWSNRPDLIKTPQRLDLDSADAVHAGWPGGKIALEFPAQERQGFVTVDVQVSAAPPEFTNARRFMLRFHLTYVASVDAASTLARQRKADQAKRGSEQIRMDQLEKLVNTERLASLEEQCRKFHVEKRSSEIMEAPTGAMHAHGVPHAQGFSPMLAHGVRQHEQQHQHQHQQPDLSSLEDQIAILNDRLHATILQGEPPHSQSPRRRRRNPTVAMEEGWFASFDFEYGCPYYFHAQLDTVQWEPPDGQSAVLISHDAPPPHDASSPPTSPRYDLYEND